MGSLGWSVVGSFLLVVMLVLKDLWNVACFGRQPQGQTCLPLGFWLVRLCFPPGEPSLPPLQMG